MVHWQFLIISLKLPRLWNCKWNYITIRKTTLAMLKNKEKMVFCCVWPAYKTILILHLNMFSKSLLKIYCGYFILTLATLHQSHPPTDKLFMSVMAFCRSCPFPSSNPGSNKSGLTSVSRAYKSPLLQMESAAEWGMEVSGCRAGGVKFERWESY